MTIINTKVYVIYPKKISFFRVPQFLSDYGFNKYKGFIYPMKTYYLCILNNDLFLKIKNHQGKKIYISEYRLLRRDIFHITSTANYRFRINNENVSKIINHLSCIHRNNLFDGTYIFTKINHYTEIKFDSINGYGIAMTRILLNCYKFNIVEWIKNNIYEHVNYISVNNTNLTINDSNDEIIPMKKRPIPYTQQLQMAIDENKSFNFFDHISLYCK